MRIQELPELLILILCLLCFSSSTTWHQHNGGHTPWTPLFWVFSANSGLQQLQHHAVRNIQGDPNHSDSAHLSGEKSITNSKQAQIWRQVIHVWNLMDPSSSHLNHFQPGQYMTGPISQKRKRWELWPGFSCAKGRKLFKSTVYVLDCGPFYKNWMVKSKKQNN